MGDKEELDIPISPGIDPDTGLPFGHEDQELEDSGDPNLTGLGLSYDPEESSEESD